MLSFPPYDIEYPIYCNILSIEYPPIQGFQILIGYSFHHTRVKLRYRPPPKKCLAGEWPHFTIDIAKKSLSCTSVRFQVG